MKWFFLIPCLVFGRQFDLITNWPMSDMEIELPADSIRTFGSDGYVYEGADLVIVMNPFLDLDRISSAPREKRVLFTWEPQDVPVSYCEGFERVYTFNDDLVDGKKYFKYCFPSLHPMEEELIPFQERKLCTMIVANWKPERIEMVRFFERRAPNDFEFYGQRCFQPYHRLYRGKVPGCVHFGKEKIATLQKYRTCICFENSEINGYITEKIFGCFTAGCIPIYLGAPNVEQYIPKNCFIDFRDFRSCEEMLRTIEEMTEEAYLQYLENIRLFLQSEQAQAFSHDHFYRIFSESR